MSRNNANNDRKVRSIMSSANFSIDEEDNSSEMHQTRRNLQSPRLNGNSIIESTQKLKEMDIMKTTRIVSRHSSVQRDNSRISNARDSTLGLSGENLINKLLIT